MDRKNLIPDNLDEQIKFAKAKSSEMGLPHHPLKRRQYLESMRDNFERGNPLDMMSKVSSSIGGSGGRLNKTASMAGADGGAGTIRSVWPKRYDPLRSPTNRNIPYWADEDAYDESEVLQVSRAWCLPPGQTITTRRGQIAIESVELGDEVLTHEGNWKPVVRLFQREYDGDVITLRGNYLPELTVTEDHKIPVRDHKDGHKLLWIPAGQLTKESGRLISPFNKDVQQTQKVTLISDEDSISGEVVAINGHMKRTNSVILKTKSETVIDNDFLWLCGLYVAEGSAAQRGITWTLNKNETKYAAEIQRITEKSMGRAAVLSTQKDNWVQYRSSGLTLRKRFAEWFGSGAHYKRIPDWIMQLSPEQQQHFLRGMIDGDGDTRTQIGVTKGSFWCRYTSVSTQLIQQFRELLLRQGIVPRWNGKDEVIFGSCEDEWPIIGQIMQLPVVMRDKIKIDGRKQSKWRHGEIRDNELLADIKQINRYHYSGMVYDVEVADDHSFVAHGTAVSNCRFYYATHHVVPTCIDIFARYPLVGCEHQCKDNGVKRFFDDVFLDDLNYEEYLVNIGSEIWKVGECFPFMEWSDDLGIPINDEIMNPDDIIVIQNLLMKSTKYKFRIPEYMKDLVDRNISLTADRYEDDYAAIIKVEPEFVDYIRNNEFLEMDSRNIYHLKHGGNPWSPRGYPILMRAFRTLLLEERLNRAQLAISERLYTPLILLLLGAQNIGENGEPWIPNQSDINRTQMLFENMMESEYRTLVHHFGLDIQVPFVGERIPNLDQDYIRANENLLGIFGISKDLLYGGRGQNYASTALSAEFLMQKLNTYRKTMWKFCKSRYERTALAQGFYDYEKKGGMLIPITEQVKVLDENGNYVIKTRKKPLIPSMRFMSMDFRAEDIQRKFLQELKESGMPISDGRVAIGIDLDVESEREIVQKEQVEKALQEARIAKLIKSEAAREGLTEYLDPKWTSPGAAPIETGVPSIPPDEANAEDDTTENNDSAPENSDSNETDNTKPPTRPEQSDERKAGMPSQNHTSPPEPTKLSHYEEKLYPHNRKIVSSLISNTNNDSDNVENSVE